MSPAQSIPAISSSRQPASHWPSYISLLGAPTSSGFEPSSIVSTNLPAATDSGQETSFPLTIDLEDPNHEMSTGLYAVMICTMFNKNVSPTIQTIHIGPGRPLVKAFKEETGEDLPEGCSIAVPSHHLKSALEGFTEGVTVFVHEPLPAPTANAKANEHLLRDFFEGLSEAFGLYFGFGLVALVCVAACGYPSYRRYRQRPGGALDREDAPGYELEELAANSHDDSADEDQSVAPAPGGPLAPRSVENRSSASDDGFGNFHSASPLETKNEVQPKHVSEDGDSVGETTGTSP